MATGGLRVAPPCVQSLMEEYGGHGLEFIMEKRITISDLNKQQNRLLIPKRHVNAIKAMLSQVEMIVANLHPTERIDNQGGLDIRVFTENKFRVEKAILKRWDSTGSTVIKGSGMKEFRAWSWLNVNDKIEMWGFRDGRDGTLCFAICKAMK